MQRAFLLRSCSDSVFESRTRPCLLFQIKRCSAPCVQRIDKPGYEELVREAGDFLKGKSQAVQKRLTIAMDRAAEALEFETAASLRDRVRAMSHIQFSQGVNPSTFEEADLFAVHSEGGQTCIQVFFFRAWQNWGNRPYFPKHDPDLPLAEVLESFIGQFYDERAAPPLILTSEELPGRALLADALSLRAETKVEIARPQRGEKREIMDRALTNAREQLGRRMAESSAQAQLLEGVADVFGLDAPPQRIEVYDNSHIQGAHALGAFIVAGPDGFEKAQYRKFNIKSEDLAPGDDYAMMREVLTRRFARMVKEEVPLDEAGSASARKWKRPDLVLIDGGPGQLSIACQVFADLGVEDVALVGISKGPDRDAGREHFYVPGKEPFRLDPKSPVLYYLQRLRDEAHRFVIGGHRKKRSAAIGTNPLDEIAGVGAGRKRALLQHFGSARAVSGASLADLSVVPGVSETLARKIFDFFHPGG
jgi:excinuclease ABC subunit C